VFQLYHPITHLFAIFNDKSKNKEAKEHLRGVGGVDNVDVIRNHNTSVIGPLCATHMVINKEAAS